MTSLQSSIFTPYAWNLCTQPDIELPPPVVIIEEPKLQNPDIRENVQNGRHDHDHNVVPLIDAAEKPAQWDGDEEDGDDNEIYYDAQEWLSHVDLEDKRFDNESSSTLPVQVYKSRNKTFYTLSNLAEFNKTFSPKPPSSSSSSSAATRGTSQWSVHTVYTMISDSASNTLCGTELSDGGYPSSSRSSEKSNLSKSSGFSSLRDLGPDPRSREEIFAKGVPWGFHGRDYIPPKIKRHKLEETMRGRIVVNKRGYFVFKVRNVFRKRKDKREGSKSEDSGKEKLV